MDKVGTKDERFKFYHQVYDWVRSNQDWIDLGDMVMCVTLLVSSRGWRLNKISTFAEPLTIDELMRLVSMESGWRLR